MVNRRLREGRAVGGKVNVSQWSQMRTRAHQALFAVGLVGVVLVQAGHPSYGFSALERLGLGLLYAACLALLQWPRQARSLPSLAVLASVLYLLSLPWTHPAVADGEGLDLLLLFTLLATAFGSPRFGDGLTLLSLAGLIPLPLVFPAWSQPVPLDHVVNLCLSLLLQQAAMRALWRHVDEGRHELEGISRSLAGHLEAVGLMSRAAFEESRLLVAELLQRLERRDHSGAAAEAGRLGYVLESCRKALPEVLEPPPPGRVPEHIKELRGHLAGFILVGGFVAAALAWVHTRLGRFDMGWYAPAWALVLGFISLLYYSPWGRRRSVFWAGSLASLVFLLLMGWRIGRMAPGLPSNFCGALLVLSLVSMADSLGLILACAGLIAAFVALLAREQPGLNLPMAAVQLGGMLAAVIAVWRLPKVLLKSLHDEGHALHRAARTRRRLVSTLFHDLANPLQEVLVAFELRKRDERVGRLAHRMQDILDVAARWEQGLGPMQEVALEPLVEALSDLFKDRLRAKELTLKAELPFHARVRASETLLRESVLGNLVSNAIKFSPRGGHIVLKLARCESGGKLELRVQDQGGGVPAAVLEALAQGRRPPSSQGTCGEPGSGYGLSLAQDYLLQMGGALRLECGAAGGTVAVVTLALV